MSKLERLTCEMEDWSLLKALLPIRAETPDDCKQCTSVCEYELGCEECPIQKAFDRLAEYERLGVTPEQIRIMDELYTEKCEEVHRLECRIKELEEAAVLREDNGK